MTTDSANRIIPAGLRRSLPSVIRVWAVLAFSLVVLSSCSQQSPQQGGGNGDGVHANNTPPKGQPDEARVVQITDAVARELDIRDETVQERNLALSLHVTGQIKPEVGKQVDVNTRFSGRVKSVKVVPGQFVRDGDILATVDSHQISELQAELIEARSKLSIAEAQEERERQIYEEQLQRPKTLIQAKTHFDNVKIQLEIDEAEFQRQEGLYREKISSAKAYLIAKGEHAKTKAAFAQAQTDLQREERLYANKALMKRDYQLTQAETHRAKQHLNTLQQRLQFLGMSPRMVQELMNTGKIVAEVPILAPSSGVITHQTAIVGEVINPEENAFTITDLSAVVVAADLPEAYIPKVKLGRVVRVKISSYPNERFQGVISYIGDHVNPETRTVAIRARLDNKDRKLKSNMFAEIDIEGQQSVILACPKSAVQERDGKKIVFVHVDDGYQERLLETGSETEQYVEVKDGVKKGERVATQGALMLKAELSYKH